MGYSGAGGKLIDEKNRSEKSRDTIPLMVFISGFLHEYKSSQGHQIRRSTIRISPKLFIIYDFQKEA
jgi:hypothetical protein